MIFMYLFMYIYCPVLVFVMYIATQKRRWGGRGANNPLCDNFFIMAENFSIPRFTAQNAASGQSLPFLQDQCLHFYRNFHAKYNKCDNIHQKPLKL